MRQAYGYANYRFASKSCLSNVVSIAFSSLSHWGREQKDPFYYASATEPFGDTIDAYLGARRILVATGSTGDPDSAETSHLLLTMGSSFCCYRG